MMSDSLGRPRKGQRLLLSLLLLGLLLISWLYRESWTPALLDLLAPALQRVEKWSQALPWNQTASETTNPPQLRDLLVENQLLQKKLTALELVAEENRQLRELLNLDMPIGYRKVAANVILRLPHHWFESILLDQGFEAGVAVNMVVVNSEGVIGKVTQVTARTARVQLISHPESTVSCIVGKQKIPGVLTGRYHQQLAQLQYLQNYASLHSGDPVRTSGLGGVYPPNLLLGTVKYVHKRSTRPVPDASVSLDPLERPLTQVVVLVPET